MLARERAMGGWNEEAAAPLCMCGYVRRRFRVVDKNSNGTDYGDELQLCS